MTKSAIRREAVEATIAYLDRQVQQIDSQPGVTNFERGFDAGTRTLAIEAKKMLGGLA